MPWLFPLLLATAHAAESLSYEPTGCDGWTESGRLRGDGDFDVSVALDDGRFLLIGASPKSPQIFDAAHAKVTLVAPGPWKFLGFASAAIVDDDTTLVVGAESAGRSEPGRRRPYAPICFAFHRSANTWETLSCPDAWGLDVDLVPVATRLANGRVVAFDGVTGAAELDPETLRWADVVRVPEAIHWHGDAALATGELLVVGAVRRASAAFRFDAVAKRWSVAAAPPSMALRPRLLSLQDGRVIELAQSGPTQLYDPARDAWENGPGLLASRSRGGAALLPDGSVLAVGGWDGNRRRVPFAEIWRPGTDAWVYAGTNCVATQDPLVVSTENDVFALGGLEADAFATEGGFTFSMRSSARIERWEASADDLRFAHGLPPRTLPALTEADSVAQKSVDWLGAAFPDLPVEIDGRTRRVSSWSGVRVIDVWATWCAPCLDAIPEIDHVADRWADRGVTVLMLSVDDDPETVASFQSGIHHAVVGWSADASDELALRGIPAMFVVAADGRVLAQHRGAGGTREWLEEALTDATRNTGSNAP